MRLFSEAFLWLDAIGVYDLAEDTLYRWYLRATIVGVVVALGGLWALRNQNRNLASQIKIQSLGLRHWVDTLRWRASIPQRMNPRMLEIAVDIVNPTTAPIVLMLIRITVSGGKVTATGYPPNTLLLPGKPLPYAAHLAMSKEQAESYRSDRGLVVQIEGSIMYIDSLKDEWEQRFQLVARFDQGFTQPIETNSYTHTLHEVKDVKVKPLWRAALDWYVAQIEAMQGAEEEQRLLSEAVHQVCQWPHASCHQMHRRSLHPNVVAS